MAVPAAHRLRGIPPRFVVVSDALWPAELHAQVTFEGFHRYSNATDRPPHIGRCYRPSSHRSPSGQSGAEHTGSCRVQASASGSPVEGPGCRGDLHLPAEVSQLSFEVRWLVGDLHEPVGGSVRELSADGRGRRAFQTGLPGAPLGSGRRRQRGTHAPLGGGRQPPVTRRMRSVRPGRGRARSR
jgi:hypothetical protein